MGATGWLQGELDSFHELYLLHGHRNSNGQAIYSSYCLRWYSIMVNRGIMRGSKSYTFTVNPHPTEALH
jgi:hypothetical protein